MANRPGPVLYYTRADEKRLIPKSGIFYRLVRRSERSICRQLHVHFGELPVQAANEGSENCRLLYFYNEKLKIALLKGTGCKELSLYNSTLGEMIESPGFHAGSFFLFIPVLIRLGDRHKKTPQLRGFL
jgi:hypothetical protein